LFIGETYQLIFCINQHKKISQSFPLHWNPDSELKVTLNCEKPDYSKEAFEQAQLLINLKKVSSSPATSQKLRQEYFQNPREDYAHFLTHKILKQLLSLKNPKLQLYRLSLWNYSNFKQVSSEILNSLPALDFGVKNTLLLRKIWQDFHLNISNEQLISESDPE